MDLDWSAAAAWIALALTIGNIIVSWYRRRAATLLVHIESRFERNLKRHEFVIYNDGPHAARNLRFEVVNPDGSPWTDVDPTRTRRRHPGDIHVPYLPARYDHRVEYTRYVSVPEVEAAELRWRDGRLRENRIVVPLTRRTVPAPHIEVKVIEDRQGRRR